MTSDTDPLASELRVVIGRLIRRLRAERRGLGLSQVTVLARLDRSGPATTSDLAAGERVRPQSMADTVGSLVDAGLAKRSHDPSDGRRVLIALTPAGREALAADRRLREGWLAAAIERDLTARERRVLEQATRLLDRLADSDVGST